MSVQLERPEEWLSLTDVARQCRRSEKTIRNLVTLHQLPRRLLWEVRNRMRRRMMFFSPATAAYLQRITLHGDEPSSVPKPRS